MAMATLVTTKQMEKLTLRDALEKLGDHGFDNRRLLHAAEAYRDVGLANLWPKGSRQALSIKPISLR
jgi:hypothetical protein